MAAPLPRLVLDTNVLVAALRSRRGPAFALLSRVGAGDFDLSLTVPLLFEYEDVLARETIGVDPDAARAVPDYLCAVATHQPGYFLWRPLLPDPKDDMVLEAAVASRSDVVTYNRKDFAGAERFGVQVQRPADVLRRIGRES